MTAIEALKGLEQMNPNEVEHIIEPFVIRYTRKVLTWAIGLLLGWLASRGIGVDPSQAPAQALAITTAIGVPLSSLLSALFDAAIRKWCPGNVLTANSPQPPAAT